MTTTPTAPRYACPVCGAVHAHQSERYKNHVCAECEKRARCSHDRSVRGYNTHMSGGFAASHYDRGDNDCAQVTADGRVWIDGVEYRMGEARFGGTVVVPLGLHDAPSPPPRRLTPEDVAGLVPQRTSRRTRSRRGTSATARAGDGTWKPDPRRFIVWVRTPEAAGLERREGAPPRSDSNLRLTLPTLGRRPGTDTRMSSEPAAPGAGADGSQRRGPWFARVMRALAGRNGRG